MTSQKAGPKPINTARRPERPAPVSSPARPGTPAGPVRQLQQTIGNRRTGEVLKAATAADATGETAPGIMELKGMPTFVPPPPIAGFLKERTRGNVNVRFGSLAAGPLEVRRAGERYSVQEQAIPLTHPLFTGALAPSLIVAVGDGGKIRGRVGFDGEKGNLAALIRKTPDLVGLGALDLSRLGSAINTLENGALHLGIKGTQIRMGGAFTGTLTLEAVNEAITFEGSAAVTVRGLASGSLELKRSTEGIVTGMATVGLTLPKGFSGNVAVGWDGRAITGEGKVGYTGEKFSGEVLLRLMEKGAAARLEAAGTAREGTPAPAATVGPRSDKVDYVVFGEGDLTFAFTDWLNGTAHVIVDPRGNLTVIGKITPQKEFILFPQKDFNKDLFKVEARASYGIPVVGNIFIFANVGMGAFAKLGPAKFYNIVVEGTYSTDPKKAQNFTVQGSLNISAAAGLRLRGEAGAGLEILSHDIKAGAGVNALAGIRGYAEATPVIGYREKGAEGEDKKGEFFIRGDMEIAAQPFLGLSGDLFVEIDAPWWSPVPDKRWTWPLVGKEWPMGGSFGVGATVDYVFGSGQAPSVEFKPVEFSAEKFMTDLYSDKATGGSGDKGEKKGAWKEKNTRAAEPPPKQAKKGAAQEGEAPKQSPAKARVTPGGPKKAKKPADPNARTADGKTVRQYQAEAEKRGKKPGTKEPEKKADKPATDVAARMGRVKTALDQALAYAEKTGIGLDELNTVLKSIRRRKEYGLKDLKARDGGENWIVAATLNPTQDLKTVKKKGKAAGAGDLYHEKPFPIPSCKEHAGAGAKHKTLYTGRAKADKLFHEKRDRKTGQVGKWESWARQNLSEPLRKKAADLGMSDRDIVRPRFNRAGEKMTFHIDHIVEYQLQGDDETENYWMLRGSENSSSGSTLKAAIAAVRAESDKKRKEDGQPATARIFFKNPVLDGNAEDTIYWRKSEIKKGDHIAAYEKHRDSLKKQLKE